MRFVSLGAWCQVAHQMERLCPDQFISGALDWTVAPLSSVPKIFDTNGERFALNVFISEPQRSVQCEEYGILYHHEYPRDASKTAIVSDAATSKARSKLSHKHAKMVATVRETTEPVTFIRFGGHGLPAQAWPYHPDHATVSPADLNKIVSSIERAILRQDFRLLFITDPSVMKFAVPSDGLDSRIVLMDVPSSSPRTWTGQDSQWDELLVRYRSLCS